MSNNKKIILLTLLLIILIVTCVFTHVGKIQKLQESKNNNASSTPILEPKVVTTVAEAKPEKPKVQKVEEPKVQEATKVKKEEPKQVSKTEIEKDEVLTRTQIKPIKEEKKEEPKVEEVVEEKPKAIELVTDRRYKRTNGDKRIENMSEATKLLQQRINDYIKEKPVNFKGNGYKYAANSYKSIVQISKILKEFPNIKLEIAGHSTISGNQKTNKQISVFRAVKVKKSLIKLGINKKRMKARGYGATIALYEDSKKDALNKRIEFNIIGE